MHFLCNSLIISTPFFYNFWSFSGDPVIFMFLRRLFTRVHTRVKFI